MAFYKNSNLSHQTLAFHSPPSFLAEISPGNDTSSNWVSELVAKSQPFYLASEGE
ncbi:putative transmembrane protein [Sesbania bispinosa]|nr:putative transmembrane protein [Sesbania bispinosa]